MKKNRYEWKLTPTFADYDYKLRLKPAAILNYFQEIAGQHANHLEVGREHLMKKGLFWVLSKVWYRVEQNPVYGEVLTVQTWPLAPGKLLCDRDYRIDGDKGAEIVGTSKWCLLDVSSHKIVPARDFDYGIENYFSVAPAGAETGKIRMDETKARSVYSAAPQYVDLDYNRHVNNAKYGDYVLNAFCPDEMDGRFIRELQINYLRECRMADQFTVYREDREGETLLEGRAEQPFFQARLKF